MWRRERGARIQTLSQRTHKGGNEDQETRLRIQKVEIQTKELDHRVYLCVCVQRDDAAKVRHIKVRIKTIELDHHLCVDVGGLAWNEQRPRARSSFVLAWAWACVP